MIPFKLIKEQKSVGEKINEDLHNIAKSKAELDKLLNEEVVDTPTEEEKEKAMDLYALSNQLNELSIEDLQDVFEELRFSTLNRVQSVLDDLRDVPNHS